MAVSALIVVAALATAAPAQAADRLAGCAAKFAARPDAYESSYCFFQVARQTKRWDEAARRLDALRTRHPANFWLTLARGHVEWTRDITRAERLTRAAAEGFARQRHATGEVEARANLHTILFRQGRLEDAGQEVVRVVRLAEASGQKLLLARALVLRAAHLTQSGRELSEAYALLRRAEQATDGESPYLLRKVVLFGLGNVCFQRGRFEEALAYYRRIEEAAGSADDRLTLTAASYSVVNTLMRQWEELPRAGAREQLLALARTALENAVEADNREIQVWLHRLLGELLSASPHQKAEAESHYARCIAVARGIHSPRELAHCLLSLGRHLAENGRAGEAAGPVAEALALVRRTGNHSELAYAARQRLRVSWRTRPREDAIRESLEALGAIEALRLLQGEEGGAEVFSAWAADYYWLAGQLLAGGGAPARREDLTRAFAVIERMRGRVLLEILSARRDGREPASDHPLVVKRRAVLQRIAETHRELLDPTLAPPARDDALRRLESLELEEEEVRRGLRAIAPRSPDVGEPQFASLEEVEAGLRPDEALLSFTIGLEKELSGQPGGGAWLTVSTRHGTKVYPVPDRVRLHAVMPVFLGLFTRRDGKEAGPGARLYRELLAPALADLPAEVTRLVVIPDDALHHLPFAALRPAPDREPLVMRYEIGLAPSATLWLRWRKTSRAVAPRSVLVLADPALAPTPDGSAVQQPSLERDAPWMFGAALGTLPHARAEGATIVRRLGRRSELWMGQDASEQALKAAPLAQFGILHLAAHAVVDEERPERSCVVLAPGSPAEDGLLQVREVVDLDLEGKSIVLSACRSAGGAILRGEGVMGLGRAFFQAGSHSVVGTLWPLRDDEAASLFDGFYRHLSGGATVGAALRAAQEDAIRAGRPAAAWAGPVAIGDADLRPVQPQGGIARLGPRSLLAAATVLGAALLWLLLSRFAGHVKVRPGPRRP